MSVCSNCGATISDGTLFCGECGVRVKPLDLHGDDCDQMHTITITRKKLGISNCEVYVNRIELGLIPAGQTITTRFASELADIEIKTVWSTGFFHRTTHFSRLLMRLEVNSSDNLAIVFTDRKTPSSKNIIVDISVTGAEILEKRYFTEAFPCEELPEVQLISHGTQHKLVISDSGGFFNIEDIGPVNVNGIALGIVPNENSILTQLYSEYADVLIGKVSLNLRIFDDVYLAVKPDGSTTIKNGAEILEKRFLK